MKSLIKFHPLKQVKKVVKMSSLETVIKESTIIFKPNMVYFIVNLGVSYHPWKKLVSLCTAKPP